MIRTWRPLRRPARLAPGGRGRLARRARRRHVLHGRDRRPGAGAAGGSRLLAGGDRTPDSARLRGRLGRLAQGGDLTDSPGLVVVLAGALLLFAAAFSVVALRRPRAS